MQAVQYAALAKDCWAVQLGAIHSSKDPGLVGASVAVVADTVAVVVVADTAGAPVAVPTRAKEPVRELPQVVACAVPCCYPTQAVVSVDWQLQFEP